LWLDNTHENWHRTKNNKFTVFVYPGFHWEIKDFIENITKNNKENTEEVNAI